MSDDSSLRLFELPAATVERKERSGGAPRILEPERGQGEMRFEIPDDRICASHQARLLWNVLGTLDLGLFSAGSASLENQAGRALLSPRMLLTLWLYAIVRGIGSAREVERLTTSEAAFQWIVGNLSVSHHTLSSFRVDHGKALDELMTDILASLMDKGLLTLDLVSEDGTRTRAAASAPSFRTYGSLLECREQAALHLKAVLAASQDPEYTKGQHARRAAAAKDYQERIEAAIATVTELQNHRKPTDKPARASTTDAEARVMKMGDGGFRPAYNVQYAVAGSEQGGPRTFVGVHVTNLGSDMGSLTPMVEQIQERTGEVPKTLLADGGYAKAEDIVSAQAKGVEVLVPPAKNAKSIEQLKLEGAAPEVLSWRERMKTDEAKQTYRARAGLCELANAHQKSHHGITQFLVRGIEKVTCVVLLNAIATNLMQHARHLL